MKPLRAWLAPLAVATALAHAPGVSAEEERGERALDRNERERVRPQVVEVPPSLDGGTFLSFSVLLPLEALDEAEVFLSLDGGKSYPVRLSEEVHGRHAVRFDVTVPNVATPTARLLVRAGGRARNGRFEIDIARSGSFAIRPLSKGAAFRPWADRGRRKRTGDHSRIEWWFFSSPYTPIDLPAASLRGGPRLEAGLGTGHAFVEPEGRPSRAPSHRVAPSRSDRRIRLRPAPRGPSDRIRLQLVAAPLPLRP